MKNKLKFLKENWHLTNAELSRRLGVSIMTINRWGRNLDLPPKKRGRPNIDWENLKEKLDKI